MSDYNCTERTSLVASSSSRMDVSGDPWSHSSIPQPQSQHRLPSRQHNHNRRHHHRRRRHVLWFAIVGAAVMTSFVAGVWHTMQDWPTEEELAWVQHYYHTDPDEWSHRRTQRKVHKLRHAQKEADEARRDLNGGDVAVVHVDVQDNNNNNDVNEAQQQQQQPLRSLRQHNSKKRSAAKEEVEHVTSQPHDANHVAQPVPHIGCETTVLILRHCEKGFVREHCAYDGLERSVYLASLFQVPGTANTDGTNHTTQSSSPLSPANNNNNNNNNARWPTPSFLFAESPRGRHSRTKMNFREVETIGPLARQSNLTIDDSHTDDTIHDLTRDVRTAVQTGALCGKVVVVSWKHSRMAHIARGLGCGPAQACPVEYHGKTFDAVWEIKLVYREWEHSTQRHEFLAATTTTTMASSGDAGDAVETKDADHVSNTISTARETSTTKKKSKTSKKQQQAQHTTTTTTAAAHLKPRTASWKVFGSVQPEGFDPLAVSKQFGDYSTPDGTPWGGRWRNETETYRERTHKKDTDGWSPTKVNLMPPPPTTTAMP